MLYGLLSPQDAVVAVAVMLLLYGLARLPNRRVTVGRGNSSLTIEEVHRKVDEISKAVGQTNGDGNLATIGERLLAESAEQHAEIVALKEQLDDRTHVTRVGRTEVEDLATYIQERMHDVLGAQALQGLKLDFLWRAAEGQGWKLPAIPSTQEPGD